MKTRRRSLRAYGGHSALCVCVLEVLPLHSLQVTVNQISSDSESSTGVTCFTEAEHCLRFSWQEM